MEDKENRETKYYLVDDLLYELAINFEQMTMSLYVLSEESTEDVIITDYVIMSNNLTANSFTNKNEISSLEKTRIVYCCMGLTRQILSFKYDSNKRVIVSHFETYP